MVNMEFHNGASLQKQIKMIHNNIIIERLPIWWKWQRNFLSELLFYLIYSNSLLNNFNSKSIIYYNICAACAICASATWGASIQQQIRYIYISRSLLFGLAIQNMNLFLFCVKDHHFTIIAEGQKLLFSPELKMLDIYTPSHSCK